MTNYIIDEKINFYKILNDFFKEIKEEEEEEGKEKEEGVKGGHLPLEEKEKKEAEEIKELCLISNEPLTKYYITLPCNHKFNYLPLLYSCFENSQLQYNNYNRKISKIKCPYCKEVNHNKVLPYNPLLETTKYRFVNYPQKNIVNAKNKCCYTYKSGKNKGNACGEKCYWKYCHKHLKSLDITKKSNTTKKTNVDLDSINIKTIGTDDLKKMTVTNLRQLAKINKKRNYSKLNKNNLILLIKAD